MNSEIIFVYDGQCPFCNYFAELLELKSNLPSLKVKDARENPSELPKGYDMDINGAILLKDNEMLKGADAINAICLQIKDPSDSLLNLLSVLFESKIRANFFFPFLIKARRVALMLKGVPRKIFF